MWNDEDNNPYGSLDRRDSDFGRSSPTYQFHQPSSPPSGTQSPQNEATDVPPRNRNLSDDDEEEPSSKRRGAYQSRIEQLLNENEELTITITHAGKNQEGGGSYIAYTIKTGELEVRRRYSDFYSLRQTLVNLHPTLIVPPIPEKHSVADYAAKPTKAKEDEAIIDYRKRMLSSFLNRCRRLKLIREDGVFSRFLDPQASWSEVMHSPPVSLLPKSNLRSPPLDAANPQPGHQWLPIPSSGAKLKSAKDQPPQSNLSASQTGTTTQHVAGADTLNKFPSTSQTPEADLDPYFVNFESSSQELETLLQGSMEKVNKRTISHLSSYSEDLAELGARFNGFSLSEQSPTLAAAIEKMGQAVDSTYIATGDLSSSLSAGFSEPMRESAQFASIVRNVLRYRIMKRVQEEMTRDELERKKTLLDQLERSEMEAKRIDQHLESSGFMPASPTPKRPTSSASPRGSTDRTRPEEDSASIDSDFTGPQADSRAAPSASQGTPQQSSESASPATTSRKNSTGNFVTNKIFGRLNHAIHGIVDVDPERTRRDQMGKTKESLVQLEQALEVSEKDVQDASVGVLRSLKEFQSEKEEDLRRYMVAYARSHIAWAKRNLASWEEAKTDVNAIQLHV
ncbi:MAG: Sorting nexin, cytoplasm-to-vacuole targeting pathway/endosomal sorting [Chrysothrix sp. TS-e1954]|nr:MAG: Sorting nexin, cytoplasm-to-vacuole targeting pathway/endosomal sorting [Chrysothrix sp. TS-e1954]